MPLVLRLPPALLDGSLLEANKGHPWLPEARMKAHGGPCALPPYSEISSLPCEDMAESFALLHDSWYHQTNALHRF